MADCGNYASGIRMGIAVVEQTVCDEIPPFVAIPSVTSVKPGGSTGEHTFTISTGSFIDDHQLRPGHSVLAAGFTTAANNGIWVVKAVAATTLTVYDAANIGVSEAVDVAQTLTLQMVYLRTTGDRGLELEINSLGSEETRPDRQIADVRNGFRQAVGEYTGELSLISYSNDIKWAMSSVWETPAMGTVGDVGFTAGSPGSKIGTISRSTGSWVTQNVRVGDVLRFDNATNPENEGNWPVLAVTAANLTVLDITERMITEAAHAGPTVVFPGGRIDTGLIKYYIAAEQRYNDIEEYQEFVGMVMNEMTIDVQPESFVNMTFTLLGLEGKTMDGTPLVATPLDAAATSAFGPFDGVMLEAGVPAGVITSISTTLNNNRTTTPVVFSTKSPDVFEGRCIIEGEVTILLLGNTMYNKWVNNTETSFFFTFQDPNTLDLIAVTIPRAKLMDVTRTNPAEGPVELSASFQGLVSLKPNASGVQVPTSMTIQATKLYQV